MISGFPPSAKSSIQLVPAGCKLCSKLIHGLYNGSHGHHSLLQFDIVELCCCCVCDGDQRDSYQVAVDKIAYI